MTYKNEQIQAIKRTITKIYYFEGDLDISIRTQDGKQYSLIATRDTIFKSTCCDFYKIQEIGGELMVQELWEEFDANGNQTQWNTWVPYDEFEFPLFALLEYAAKNKDKWEDPL